MIPFLLAVAPLVGYFGGRWLDQKLGTEPVLTFLLLAMGFVAGVRETIIVIRKATKEAEDADKGVG
jgi:F0F1-type ATP synthase assembly protein I